MAEIDSTRLTGDTVVRYSARKGRRFALTLAGAFALLAFIGWWRGRETAALALGVLAFLFAISAVIAPSRLEPVERGWMAIAKGLSKITTPVFMGIVYFVVLSPIGALRRGAGRNPLVREPVDDSYWIPRVRTDPLSRRRRMERQF